MSFRNRLILFFFLIVVVPMVAVGVVLFDLIANNESGKADARLNANYRAAVHLSEQDRVDAHVERCLRQLGFSACESHVLNGAGADHHYAEHLVRDLGYSVDQTYELLRP